MGKISDDAKFFATLVGVLVFIVAAVAATAMLCSTVEENEKNRKRLEAAQMELWELQVKHEGYKWEGPYAPVAPCTKCFEREKLDALCPPGFTNVGGGTCVKGMSESFPTLPGPALNFDEMRDTEAPRWLPDPPGRVMPKDLEIGENARDVLQLWTLLRNNR